MKKAAFNLLRLVCLGIGLFVLWGVIQKMGWSAIQEQIGRLGWQFLPILAVGFGWNICYTLAWRQCLTQQRHRIPFWALFRAKVCGETVNVMTPANFLGGDPMRIYLLRNIPQIDITSLTASVVVDRTINSIAIVAVIFLGAATAFLTLPGMPAQIKIGAPVFLTLSSGLILFFLLRQRKGLFTSILKLAQKLHLPRHWIDRHLEKARELDEKVLTTYQASHSVFWLTLLFHITGRLLGVVEVYWIGEMMTSSFTFRIALLLATLSPIINATFTFIPGALGIMEGAYSGALYLLGLNPAIGLTIQIVKRVRATVWIGLGLIFIYSFRPRRTSGDSRGPLRPPLQSAP